MDKIKEPAVADMFYSGNAGELRCQIKGFAQNNSNTYKYRTRAVIVPHAGLVYSGKLAYEGISQLDGNIKNLFIFAPAHRIPFEGTALSGFDEWSTPLGNIPVNQDINKDLEENFGAKIFDEAHREEHSIEIELPVIQSLFSDVKIIPVLYCGETPQKIADIISKYYERPDCGFIISSDLSHYLKDGDAVKTDSETASIIESGAVNLFKQGQACGVIGICGLTQFANSRNYSLIRINMLNSSAASGDKSRVVGYGAWFLYEGSKNQFIKEYYSEFLLKLCRDVIMSRFDNSRLYISHPSVLNETGACFVTLKKQGQLRGCIGSIIAHQPLINDLVQNSQSAAFRDPRFNPVEKSEMDEITMDISLLSEPKPMSFKDEADLLAQMIPYKDGIIIRDNNCQAVYLPSVWEELPDKEIFLKSLKIKAGLKPEHFSPTFEAYRFETEYIEQN